MKTKITVDRIMGLGPCSEWSRDRVESIVGNGLTPDELAEELVHIDPPSARWLLARLLTTDQRAEWACRCAERVLPIWEAYAKTDKRPHKAIEAARVGTDAADAADAAASAYDAAYDASSAESDHAYHAYYAADAAASSCSRTYVHAARAAESAAIAASDSTTRSGESAWQIREACSMLEVASW